MDIKRHEVFIARECDFLVFDKLVLQNYKYGDLILICYDNF